MVELKISGDKVTAKLLKFNWNIVELIKSIPTRKYDPNTKLWSIDKIYTEQLISKFEKNGILYKASENIIPKKEVAETNKVDLANIKPLINFNFKTNPYPHQIYGFNFGLTHKKWLLADEQGLGKTKQIIDIYVAKKQLGEVKRCLIVAKTTLKYNWMQEFKIHSDINDIVVVDGTKSQREKVWKEILTRFPEVLITNYENLRVDLDEWKKIVKYYDFVAIDESHKIKNPKAQVTKAIMELFKNTPNLILATGTPIINKIEECYTTLRLLNAINCSYYQFTQKYCVFGGYGGYQIIGYKNIKEIEALLKNRMLRRKKDEVLNLPNKIRQTIYVELEGKQKRLYNTIEQEITAELLAELGTNLNVSNALTKLLRLKQVTSTPEVFTEEINNAKIEALVELLDDIIYNGHKAIIFTQFKSVITKLVEATKKYNPVVITGDTKNRQEVVDEFQNNPNVKIFIGTAQSCREGLTLTAADYVIFLDKEWAPAYVEQAEDRAHRIGQNKPVTIISLIAKDTIDERIENILAGKKSLFESFIEGKGANTKELIMQLLGKL